MPVEVPCREILAETIKDTVQRASWTMTCIDVRHTDSTMLILRRHKTWSSHQLLISRPPATEADGSLHFESFFTLAAARTLMATCPHQGIGQILAKPYVIKLNMGHSPICGGVLVTLQPFFSRTRFFWRTVQMLFILLGIILLSLWRVADIAEPVGTPVPVAGKPRKG